MSPVRPNQLLKYRVPSPEGVLRSSSEQFLVTPMAALNPDGRQRIAVRRLQLKVSRENTHVTLFVFKLDLSQHSSSQKEYSPDAASGCKQRCLRAHRDAGSRWLSGAMLLLSWIAGAAVEGKVFATQMSPRVVNTQYGQLRGLLVTLPNPHLPQVDAYLGLQYASVLGGDLRFMPPTSPLETWDGIRVAMQFRPVCPQKLPDIEKLEKTLPLGRVDHYKRILPFLGRQAEECLNLNVYVPVRGE
ncbi:hypothetical protein LSH36_215g02011 [Paralvinella palmiformis]|uniref:Carboxylesterase type B domain-containing protein n=1 Tax=Paralvinella palmiformis TaxID=53620 RepID=A0AAD9JPS2_9ANNE|nr:hypothetical protein LSH36_215g02011 [Paralvinella palmiformis]